MEERKQKKENKDMIISIANKTRGIAERASNDAKATYLLGCAVITVAANLSGYKAIRQGCFFAPYLMAS